MEKKTVNIRVFQATRDRLKIKAVRERKTIMSLVEELSKGRKQPEVKLLG